MDGINQIHVNPQIGLTFASGLRHIVRQDPDVIMVGEVRDRETADIAIRASLTGHFVYSTLHTNDAPSAITRLTDMGVENYLITSSLVAVLAQRLVRVICTHCKRPAKVSRALLEESGLDPVLEHSHRFYEGVGCIECNGTGYKGRQAICELLDLSDRIREMILEKRPTSEIKKAAREEGMRFLRESAVERVFEGITTLREINKVTFVE
jgi:type IV pilus assembly protein PilB